jgi:hypothetical protein
MVLLERNVEMKAISKALVFLVAVLVISAADPGHALAGSARHDGIGRAGGGQLGAAVLKHPPMRALVSALCLLATPALAKRYTHGSKTSNIFPW